MVEPSKPTGLSVGELAAWKAEAGKGMQAAQAHWKLMGKDLRAKATEAQQLEMKALAEKADQARTVDNTPPADAVKAAPATPATTDSTDEFVAAMERAEGAAK